MSRGNTDFSGKRTGLFARHQASQAICGGDAVFAGTVRFATKQVCFRISHDTFSQSIKIVLESSQLMPNVCAKF